MNLVISVDHALLDPFFQSLIVEHGFETLPVAKNETHRTKRDDLLIVGYSSGRIVANQLNAQSVFLKVLRKMKPPSDRPLVIGSDEAGKGEWLGPMTVAAVAMNDSLSLEFQSFGVMDSKALSTDRVRELANVIRDRALAYYEVLITPQKFNTLVIDLATEDKTLNELLAWGHSKAIERVFEGLASSSVELEELRLIIDEFDRFATERRLQRIIHRTNIEVIQSPSAERYTAVAAASILARDARESWIDRKSGLMALNLRDLDPISAANRGDFYQIAKATFLSSLATPEVLLDSAKFALESGQWKSSALAAWLALETLMKNDRSKESGQDRLERFGEKYSLGGMLVRDLKKAASMRNQIAHDRKDATEEEARWIVDKVEEALRTTK